MKVWRKMWDSNPRNLAARQFSRLQVSTTHPIFRQNLYLLNQRVGRGNRARTCDLCFPKAAHYQPVLSPEPLGELDFSYDLRDHQKLPQLFSVALRPRGMSEAEFRSEERRVGKGCDNTFRSRGSRYP